ncbi:MAG: RecX family transcriptional regulator [Christensenellaceae bacterium]|nr:RecX family transcriptional regulator [Christensenellaceae bacterium]
MNWEVVDIQPQKRKKDRFNIITDEGYLLSLSAETIVKHRIKKGTVVDEARLEQLRQEDNVKYAKELAANYLGYAPRTRAQVEKHLAGKGLDEKSIAAAVETCREYGYIDDEDYARQMAKSYSTKLGKRAIVEKMRQRGLEEAVIAGVEFSGEEQEKAAAELAEKLHAKYAGLPELKRRQRIYGALIRKGFSYEEAARLSRGGGEEQE